VTHYPTLRHKDWEILEVLKKEGPLDLAEIAYTLGEFPSDLLANLGRLEKHRLILKEGPRYRLRVAE